MWQRHLYFCLDDECDKDFNALLPGINNGLEHYEPHESFLSHHVLQLQKNTCKQLF